MILMHRTITQLAVGNPNLNDFADNDPPKVLYQQSYLHINSAVMRSIFESCEQKLDPYLLRKQLQRLTVSAEAFVMVRNIFAETYAAFSIAQWLLGIGDRHLSNYLLATDTGNIFPIDFGHAFGSAVQFLPIPELVPIRLTRQFVKLLAPLTVNGKLKQTMVHALRALRKDKQILLATMNIFVLEPSVDWLQNARKSAPSGMNSVGINPQSLSRSTETTYDAPLKSEATCSKSPFPFRPGKLGW